MSLLASASPWESESRKRIPTMRKTQKRLPSLEESSLNEVNMIDDERPTSFQEDQGNNDERSERVNQLLDNMSNVLQDNDGGKLADFKPVPPPSIQKKTDEKLAYGRSGDEVLQPIPNHLQVQPPKIEIEPSNFGPSSQDLGIPHEKNPYSNFRRIYEPSKMRIGETVNTTKNFQPVIDNKLLEKINYMIHMLEQQQNEKTSNITEEFVLYTFLGVFIIFIVDSFARTGKYIR